MGATGGVEALVGKDETLDRLSVHDVGFDDFVDVVRGDAAVPDLIGIHDDCWAVLALVKAARHVGAHAFLKSAQSQFLLEQVLQLGLTRGVAAAARMARLAPVAADEKMLFKLGHSYTLQETGLGARGSGPGA